jgi:LuxR family maltose regulon positive regulatory protein
MHFWTRVSAALDQVISGLLAAMRRATGSRHYRSADVLLAALHAALPTIPSPTLLVLDDYHELHPDNVAVHAAVAHLVGHLPSQLRLVVASRTIPPLPLAGLRARHRLLEFGATDLQFTLTETLAFLNQHVQQDLTGEEVAVLQARTEGQVAALQLAALSLRDQADPHAWIARLSGANRHIFDYLVEEVVKRMPSHLYTFALQIALLDRLSGPLCDAVTRTSSSQAMLEEMERANLFLVSLDDRREWYRLHPLFADVLRRHLRHTRPRLAPHLYARASAWCESHALTLDAIDYALAADEYKVEYDEYNEERTAQLIEAYIPSALASGYHLLLRERLERLPDKLIRARPRLAVAHAYTLYLSGERTVLPQRVQEAEQAIARAAPQLDPAELAVLQAEELAPSWGKPLHAS